MDDFGYARRARGNDWKTARHCFGGRKAERILECGAGVHVSSSIIKLDIRSWGKKSDAARQPMPQDGMLKWSGVVTPHHEDRKSRVCQMRHCIDHARKALAFPIVSDQQNCKIVRPKAKLFPGL
jgi:hypothetical protein